MTLEARLFVGLALATALVYAATPVAIRVAGRYEFFDRPAGYKGHVRPTPYLGGAALMAGFVAAMLVAAGDLSRTVPVVSAVGVLWAVGTVDDRRQVSPGLRVLVELALAAGLWALDLGWELGLGTGLDLVATALWILAVVNAFNLFDNMDGASSSMALVVAAAVAVLGVVESDAWLAASGAALAGACMGFLPHNLARPNARIFLGDGGSMPLGFAVAALVMTGASDALPAWQALAAGALFVGIPLLDTTLVVISRTRRGISVLTGGRDHLTHRTRRHLRDARAVAAALGGAQAIIAVLALASVEGSSVLLVGAVLATLVAAGTAITVLEVQEATLERAAAPGPGPDPAASLLALAREPRRFGLGTAAIVVLAAGAALSPFFFGYYDAAKWVPIGLGLTTVLAGGLIARPPQLGRPAALALAGITGLGAWQLLSAAWADSIHQAVLEGNRTLVLAAVVALALVLVRTDARVLVLGATLAAGIAVVAAVVVWRMASGHPGDLFLTGRLDRPLGYINAQATVFAIGLWLAVAVGERRRWPVAAGGAAGATLLASLVLLSASRGAALAVLGSVLVAVALLPGRLRRVCLLATIAAGVAVASGPLLHVYDGLQAGEDAGGLTQKAVLAALLAAIGVGLLWGAATAVADALRRSGRLGDARRGVAVLLAAVGVVGLGAAGVAHSRITDRIDDQYDAFVNLGTPDVAPGDSGSRLISGAGHRYDYWRIAWHTFEDAPVRGVGAGGYDVGYFRERATTEDIRQPHSIELQALAETGLVGAALLLTLLVGVGLGAWRTARAAVSSDRDRTLAVAAVGGFSAWLVHTSVDWMHLIPGVTAIALLLAACLLREAEPVQRRRSPAGGTAFVEPPSAPFSTGSADAHDAGGSRVVEPAPARAGAAGSGLRPRTVAIAAAVGLALVTTAASLTRQGLADRFEDRARSALADDPAQALREADRSLRLDGESVTAAYVRAAAQARFDRGADAEHTLLRAAATEPEDFVTWTLLGDLAVRRGRIERARVYYERAARLNPRDPGLRQLALDPSAALR